MSKPVDYEILRNVIMEGTAQACRDAGLTYFAVSCEVFPVLHRNKHGQAVIAPEAKVEVIELTAEQADEIITAQHKLDGN